ncbi:C40 family peptidase [Glaciimonas sp. PAMC28666]|nr:C40 family peptidase [Glaciimonas sp. PAMC28666]QRX83531.1 C40 family peptidase [Glaciimonas sp. PAMC28666]
MTILKTFCVCCCALLLAACGSGGDNIRRNPQVSNAYMNSHVAPSDTGNEIVIYSLGLIDTNYRFGGKNPEAGLDCSGMVTYVFKQAVGLTVTGSAAMIAQKGREVPKSELRPGDLVFFNTMHKAFSHVGIYIGDGRFINAPSTNGKVRIDRLENTYYAQRFESVRRYFD